MNEDLKQKLRKMRKRIDTSSGCGYLYHHFDDLVKELEIWTERNPQDENVEELIETIEAFSCECGFCTRYTYGWQQYAARSLYCADYLLKFVKDASKRNQLEDMLLIKFDRIMDSGAIIFVEGKLLQKYLLHEAGKCNHQRNYQRIIKQATESACSHHPVEEDVEYVAFKSSKLASQWIREYLDRFGDYSLLKKWIPAMDTVRLADIWYNFPDRHIRSRAPRFVRMIESIEKYLDDSLEIHLQLWNLWFEHDKQEVLETVRAEDLIEILEVTEDKDFCRIMNELVKIPGNEKVREIMEHFAEDDEDWIVSLSKRLLRMYET